MQEIGETFLEEQQATAGARRRKPRKPEARPPVGKPAGPQQLLKRRSGPWRVLEIFTWSCVVSMTA
eukprot:13640827-Heterocapsa_arctica.AAC.1